MGFFLFWVLLWRIDSLPVKTWKRSLFFYFVELRWFVNGVFHMMCPFLFKSGEKRGRSLMIGHGGNMREGKGWHDRKRSEVFLRPCFGEGSLVILLERDGWRKFWKIKNSSFSRSLNLCSARTMPAQRKTFNGSMTLLHATASTHINRNLLSYQIK